MAKETQQKAIEHFFERWLFRSRWLLAPSYIVLAGVLAVLSYKSIEELIQLFVNLRVFDESRTILQALTIVDVVLVLNLVLMVMFVGYTNFISAFDFKEYIQEEELAEKEIKNPIRRSDVPPWMSRLDYSGLKVQLMGSIIAIAAITTLRIFIELTAGAPIQSERMIWITVIFIAFLLAALISAVINRLKHVRGDHRDEGDLPN